MARTTAIICNGANDILFGENIYNKHNLWQEQNSHRFVLSIEYSYFVLSYIYSICLFHFRHSMSVSRTCLFCFLRRESVLFSPYNAVVNEHVLIKLLVVPGYTTGTLWIQVYSTWAKTKTSILNCENKTCIRNGEKPLSHFTILYYNTNWTCRFIIVRYIWNYPLQLNEYFQN
jgi:hypothetical protein